MKYKIVKLKKENEEYKKHGLRVGMLGLLLKEHKNKYSVLFFNSFNQGDYLVLQINREDLETTEMILPEKLCTELEECIKTKHDKIMQKTSFSYLPFKECEYVELITDKEKYSKNGVYKGDRGVIALNRAMNNQVLVDFSNKTNNEDGLVSVDFEDLKKVRE